MAKQKIVVVEGVSLGRAEKALLAEALRLANETREVMEDALTSLGRWLLVHVFEDDAGRALVERNENPIFRELLSRAGGPTLRLGRNLLHLSVRLAAYDKRITDESWRLLEPGRKALLLGLRDETDLREAAQKVVALKLTHTGTRSLVRGILEARGTKPKRRNAPIELERANAALTEPAFRRAMLKASRAAEAGEKKVLEEHVRKLRDAMSALYDEMKKVR